MDVSERFKIKVLKTFLFVSNAYVCVQDKEKKYERKPEQVNENTHTHTHFFSLLSFARSLSIQHYMCEFFGQLISHSFA